MAAWRRAGVDLARDRRFSGNRGPRFGGSRREFNSGRYALAGPALAGACARVAWGGTGHHPQPDRRFIF